MKKNISDVKTIIDNFHKKIENLNEKIESTTNKIKQYKIAIKAFQDICEHKYEDGSDAFEVIGYDSHKNHYKCEICGYETSV